MGHIAGGPEGDSEGPFALLQVCGFPDGLQYPQAVWHRGAPVCTLSHSATQSWEGKLRHAAGFGALHPLHCEPTLRFWPRSGCMHPALGPNKLFQTLPAAGGVWVAGGET